MTLEYALNLHLVFPYFFSYVYKLNVLVTHESTILKSEGFVDYWNLKCLKPDTNFISQTHV